MIVLFLLEVVIPTIIGVVLVLVTAAEVEISGENVVLFVDLEFVESVEETSVDVEVRLQLTKCSPTP